MIKTFISWGPAILWAGFIFWLSSQTWEQGPSNIQINDKVAHVLLFTVFGLVLAWAGRQVRSTRRRRSLLLLGILYAAADEWHQSLIPFRDPSLWDFLADLHGVVLGFVLGWVVLRALGEGEYTVADHR